MNGYTYNDLMHLLAFWYIAMASGLTRNLIQLSYFTVFAFYPVRGFPSTFKYHYSSRRYLSTSHITGY